MRSLRSLAVVLTLALVGLMTAPAPARADDDNTRSVNWRRGFHNNWYGGYARPYYWNSSNYNPYRGYSPYRNWAGTARGYYGRYPYYNWSRTYPWGWYY